MDGHNNGLFRNLQIFCRMKTGNNKILSNVAANYLELRLLGLLIVGSGPGKIFFVPPARTDRLKHLH
jgi:hypothetical protein